MAVFSNMIDVSASNAYIIYMEINPSHNKECQRLICLQNGKCLPQNSNAAQLVKQIKNNSEPSTSKPHANPSSPVFGLKRGRCHICTYDIKANKHSLKCDSCKKFVFQSHHTKNITCKTCDL